MSYLSAALTVAFQTGWQNKDREPGVSLLTQFLVLQEENNIGFCTRPLSPQCLSNCLVNDGDNNEDEGD